MRSTRQLLEKKFQPSERHHHERAMAINAARENLQLPPLSYPEEYIDSIFQTVMHRPMDISIAEDEKIMVDYKSLQHFRNSGKGHPLNRQPLLKDKQDNGFPLPEPYREDVELGKRISVVLMIEELKLHAMQCEASRQELLMKSLDGKTDQEAASILALQQAVSTEEIYRAYGHTHEIPNHFLGHAPHNTVMTLPVILDGQYHIDFFELVKTLPDNHIHTDEELAHLQEELAEYKKQKIAHFEKERDQQISDIPPVSEELTEEHRMQRINAIQRMHEFRVSGVNQLTTRAFATLEPEEYSNPFTGMPITAIEINYDLLLEIDLFLDPFELQIQEVNRKIHQHDRMTKKILGTHASYAELLRTEKYPQDKVPESVNLGRIVEGRYVPKADNLEVMTHPVLLDGEYLIDHQRLMAFWAPCSGWLNTDKGLRGINPFTMQPIKTIAYHEALKEASDQFLLNRNGYKQVLNTKTVQNGSYLRKDTPKAQTFLTLQSGIFQRPRAIGVSSLIESAIEEAQKNDASKTSNNAGKN